MRKRFAARIDWRKHSRKRKFSSLLKDWQRKWNRWKGKTIFLNILKGLTSALQIVMYTVVVVKLVKGENSGKVITEKRQSD